MSRNLIARVLVAAVAIPIILWISYQGGRWLLGMVSLFALLAMLEFLRAEGFRPKQLLFWLALVTAAVVFYFLNEGGATLESTNPTLAHMTVAGLVVSIFFFLTALIVVCGRQSAVELFVKHARLVWGVCYITILYPFVFLLGQYGPFGAGGRPSGGDSLLFLFAILWIGDTAAMWVGSSFGKHKLAPTVSPNKTIEGFVGGLLAAIVVGVVMVFWKFDSIPWYHVLLMALGCSVCGQLGDLVESMWKRSLGIKDSSAIIPGHGGVLDRFDSLLFAAPFMYVYFRLFSPA